jgi:hypothetical protein
MCFEIVPDVRTRDVGYDSCFCCSRIMINIGQIESNGPCTVSESMTVSMRRGYLRWQRPTSSYKT